ncbi:hypothetical protein C922_01750 [Plasmodium inui San Antonio 1]|uniref:Uncharacterized protein n=1 Tax=Plasmodium inui San Antonio 1 TaxID=1237626 RepID=W7A7J2_9APIC|nr:hypothetical protein C922_01750 [Plasmodium inui San Antonio 1]EUD67565.1 hypothetical protein C922_01750 [Plasmodium inui San Antonio 1]
MRRREWSVASSGGSSAKLGKGGSTRRGCSACSASSADGTGGIDSTASIPSPTNSIQTEKKKKTNLRGAPSTRKAATTRELHMGTAVRTTLRAGAKRKRRPQLTRKVPPKEAQKEENQLVQVSPPRRAQKVASLATYAHKYRLTKTCSLKKGCQKRRNTSTPRGGSNGSERQNGLMEEQQKYRVHYNRGVTNIEGGPSVGMSHRQSEGKPSWGKIKPMTKLKKKKNEQLLGGWDQLSDHLKHMNGEGVTGGACPGDVSNWDELYSFFPYVYNRVDSDGSRGEKGTPNGGVTSSPSEYAAGQIFEGVKERRSIREADVCGADTSFGSMGTVPTMGFHKKHVGEEDSSGGDDCHGEYPPNEHRVGSSSNEEDIDGEFHQLRGREPNGDLSNDYITYKQYVLKRDSNGRNRMEEGRSHWEGNSDTPRITHRGYSSDGEGGKRGEGIIEYVSADVSGHLRDDMDGPPWVDVNREGVPPTHEMQSEPIQRRDDKEEAESKQDRHHVCVVNNNHFKSPSSDNDALDDVHSNFADSFTIKHLPEVPNDVDMVCSSDDASIRADQHAWRSSLTGELAMNEGGEGAPRECCSSSGDDGSDGCAEGRVEPRGKSHVGRVIDPNENVLNDGCYCDQGEHFANCAQEEKKEKKKKKSDSHTAVVLSSRRGDRLHLSHGRGDALSMSCNGVAAKWGVLVTDSSGHFGKSGPRSQSDNYFRGVTSEGRRTGSDGDSDDDGHRDDILRDALLGDATACMQGEETKRKDLPNDFSLQRPHFSDPLYSHNTDASIMHIDSLEDTPAAPFEKIQVQKKGAESDDNPYMEEIIQGMYATEETREVDHSDLRSHSCEESFGGTRPHPEEITTPLMSIRRGDSQCSNENRSNLVHRNESEESNLIGEELPMSFFPGMFTAHGEDYTHDGVNVQLEGRTDIDNTKGEGYQFRKKNNNSSIMDNRILSHSFDNYDHFAANQGCDGELIQWDTRRGSTYAGANLNCVCNSFVNPKEEEMLIGADPCSSLSDAHVRGSSDVIGTEPSEEVSHHTADRQPSEDKFAVELLYSSSTFRSNTTEGDNDEGEADGGAHYGGRSHPLGKNDTIAKTEAHDYSPEHVHAKGKKRSSSFISEHDIRSKQVGMFSIFRSHSAHLVKEPRRNCLIKLDEITPICNNEMNRKKNRSGGLETFRGISLSEQMATGREGITTKGEQHENGSIPTGERISSNDADQSGGNSGDGNNARDGVNCTDRGNNADSGNGDEPHAVDQNWKSEQNEEPPLDGAPRRRLHSYHEEAIASENIYRGRRKASLSATSTWKEKVGRTLMCDPNGEHPIGRDKWALNVEGSHQMRSELAEKTHLGGSIGNVCEEEESRMNDELMKECLPFSQETNEHKRNESLISHADNLMEPFEFPVQLRGVISSTCSWNDNCSFRGAFDYAKGDSSARRDKDDESTFEGMAYVGNCGKETGKEHMEVDTPYVCNGEEKAEPNYGEEDAHLRRDDEAENEKKKKKNCEPGEEDFTSAADNVDRKNCAGCDDSSYSKQNLHSKQRDEVTVLTPETTRAGSRYEEIWSEDFSGSKPRPMEEHTSEKEVLSGENAKLSSENEVLSEENDKLRGLNETLRGENATLTKLNETLSGENKKLAGFNETLRGENATLTGLNETLRKCKTGWIELNETLSRENANLSALNDILSEENAKLDGLNETLNGENAKLAAEKEALGKSNAKLSSELDELKKEEEKHRRENGQLQEELTQLRRDSADARDNYLTEVTQLRRDAGEAKENYLIELAQLRRDAAEAREACELELNLKLNLQTQLEEFRRKCERLENDKEALTTEKMNNVLRINNLKEQLNRESKSMKELTKELRDREEEIVVRRGELTTMEKTLNETKAEVQQLKNQIEIHLQNENTNGRKVTMLEEEVQMYRELTKKLQCAGESHFTENLHGSGEECRGDKPDDGEATQRGNPKDQVSQRNNDLAINPSSENGGEQIESSNTSIELLKRPKERLIQSGHHTEAEKKLSSEDYQLVCDEIDTLGIDELKRRCKNLAWQCRQLVVQLGICANGSVEVPSDLRSQSRSGGPVGEAINKEDDSPRNAGKGAVATTTSTYEASAESVAEQLMVDSTDGCNSTYKEILRRTSQVTKHINAVNRKICSLRTRSDSWEDSADYSDCLVWLNSISMDILFINRTVSLMEEGAQGAARVDPQEGVQPDGQPDERPGLQGDDRPSDPLNPRQDDPHITASSPEEPPLRTGVSSEKLQKGRNDSQRIEFKLEEGPHTPERYTFGNEKSEEANHLTCSENLVTFFEISFSSDLFLILCHVCKGVLEMSTWARKGEEENCLRGVHNLVNCVAEMENLCSDGDDQREELQGDGREGHPEREVVNKSSSEVASRSGKELFHVLRTHLHRLVHLMKKDNWRKSTHEVMHGVCSLRNVVRVVLDTFLNFHGIHSTFVRTDQPNGYSIHPDDAPPKRFSKTLVEGASHSKGTAHRLASLLSGLYPSRGKNVKVGSKLRKSESNREVLRSDTDVGEDLVEVNLDHLANRVVQHNYNAHVVPCLIAHYAEEVILERPLAGGGTVSRSASGRSGIVIGSRFGSKDEFAIQMSNYATDIFRRMSECMKWNELLISGDSFATYFDEGPLKSKLTGNLVMHKNRTINIDTVYQHLGILLRRNGAILGGDGFFGEYFRRARSSVLRQSLSLGASCEGTHHVRTALEESACLSSSVPPRNHLTHNSGDGNKSASFTGDGEIGIHGKGSSNITDASPLKGSPNRQPNHCDDEGGSEYPLIRVDNECVSALFHMWHAMEKKFFFKIGKTGKEGRAEGKAPPPVEGEAAQQDDANKVKLYKGDHQSTMDTYLRSMIYDTFQCSDGKKQIGVNNFIFLLKQLGIQVRDSKLHSLWCIMTGKRDVNIAMKETIPISRFVKKAYSTNPSLVFYEHCKAKVKLREAEQNLKHLRRYNKKLLLLVNSTQQAKQLRSEGCGVTYTV